jgi:hypothetical protein
VSLMPSTSGSHPGSRYPQEAARHAPEDGRTPLASLPDLLAVSTIPPHLSGWWAFTSSSWRHSAVAATLREAPDQIVALKEDVDRLRQLGPGQEVVLKEILDGGGRALVMSHADEERIARLDRLPGRGGDRIKPSACHSRDRV